MLYAIIQDGGKQYQAIPGKALDIELRDAAPGTVIEFPQVVLYRSETETVLGTPFVDKIKVEATVENHRRSDKLTIFKFIRREGYKRKIGYRHDFTRVRIQKIVKE